jgi:transcription initiation factor TFIIH subunit 4
MKKKRPIIPEHISAQILLWEAERNRIQYNKGVLYDSFPSETIFKDVVEYAQNCGVYIWHQQEKQLLMVTEEGHDFVRQFIKKKIS